MADVLTGLVYHPRMPRRRDLGIGIVGAGGIVNYAHLPAYRKAGFRVVGITDRVREKAEKTARDHNIPRVYESLDELLRDPEVAIVDIAVYPWEQVRIVESAAAARKHMLCQKPLADRYADAVRIVGMAREAGVKLAVNQQMRWDAGIRCAKLLIERGWLGSPTYATIQGHYLTDWSLWPWIYQGRRIEILYHSVHYIDSLRYLFGEPQWVFSSGSRAPNEATEGETKTVTIWEFPSGLQVLIDVNHTMWADDRYAIYRFEGTEGVIKGTIGLLYNYPTGRPDTLEFTSKRYYPQYWFSARLETMWIPDAFIGPMASLMCAIEEGAEPETSGEDNLKTLQIVFAAYRSMVEKRAVCPAEITE